VNDEMSKVLYKPVGLALSVAGGLVASAVFKRVWQVLAGEPEPPKATGREYGWAQVLAAAALQGAIFGFVKAAIDRGGAVGVRKVTGHWPE
jgi:Protein of unknown function (DUF4235)